MRHHPFHPLDVFTEVEGFARRVDALFESAAESAGQTWRPVLDVRETDEGWTLTADLPGVDPDTLEIDHDGDVLVLRGETAQPDAADGEWRAVRRERRAGRFERRVRFARPVEAASITAQLTDGVLTVQVPRRRPTRVPVSIDVARA